MTDLDTNPAQVVQSTAEDITWGIDVTAQLSGAQTVTAVSTTLTSPTGTAVTLLDAPDVTGNVIRQRVRAGLPRPGNYRLAVLWTPSGTTDILESVLTIWCP